MKKIIGYLFAVFVFATALMMCGCAKRDRVRSVAIKGYEAGAVIEAQMGKFDYGEYMLTVCYESGRTEDIPLTEDMIDGDDVLAFYKEGEHTVGVIYGGKTAEFKVSVKRNTFGDVSFGEDKVFTYDGTAHTVEIEGDIPSGAVVTYPGGNSFVNAGTYDVSAVITCEGYVTKTVTATVTVKKAVYDISGITFDSGEFVYDGSMHSLSVSGTLPEGVSAPTYYINNTNVSGAVDAGSYTVTAIFANSNPNYELIPNMEATLTIHRADYDASELELIFKNELGSELAYGAKTYDNGSVLAEIYGADSLPAGVTVSYAVSVNGAEAGAPQTSVSFKNAGVYTVTAIFSIADNKNYNEIAPISGSFEITKAEYDMENIYFDSDIFAYDGKAHSISVSSVLPVGVEVRYEYYLNGEMVKNEAGEAAEAVSAPGVYTVKAVFSHSNENYGPIDDMTAKLEIKAAEVTE